MTALEHTHCSCPLPARLEGRRDKMRRGRCGLQHVRHTRATALIIIISIAVQECCEAAGLLP